MHAEIENTHNFFPAFQPTKALDTTSEFFAVHLRQDNGGGGGNHTLRERGQPQLAHAQEDAGHPQQHPRLAEARQLDGGDAVGAGPAREGV